MGVCLLCEGRFAALLQTACEPLAFRSGQNRPAQASRARAQAGNPCLKRVLRLHRIDAAGANGKGAASIWGVMV